MQPRSILITGASSGIGRALALGYARPGVSLSLDRARHRTAGGRCHRRPRAGRRSQPRSFWMCAIKTPWRNGSRPPTPAVPSISSSPMRALRRVSSPGEIAEDPDAVRAIIGINLIGVLNTVEPLIGPMCARGCRPNRLHRLDRGAARIALCAVLLRDEGGGPRLQRIPARPPRGERRASQLSSSPAS